MAALPDEAARTAVRQALDPWRGATVYLSHDNRHDDQQHRVMAARTQLASGHGRADVVRILMARFGVSRRQGYLDVQQALEPLHKTR